MPRYQQKLRVDSTADILWENILSHKNPVSYVIIVKRISRGRDQDSVAIWFILNGLKNLA